MAAAPTPPPASRKSRKGGEKIAKNAGKNGANGTNGATGTQAPRAFPGRLAPKVNSPKGKQGSEFKVGPERLQGEEGQKARPGPPAASLPPEATETGAWSYGKLVADQGENHNEIELRLPISFTIPLKEALPAHYIFGVASKGGIDRRMSWHFRIAPGQTGQPLHIRGSL